MYLLSFASPEKSNKEKEPTKTNHKFRLHTSLTPLATKPAVRTFRGHQPHSYIKRKKLFKKHILWHSAKTKFETFSGQKYFCHHAPCTATSNGFNSFNRTRK